MPESPIAMPEEAQQHLAQIPDDRLRQQLSEGIGQLHHIDNPQDSREAHLAREFQPEFVGDSERVRLHMISLAERSTMVHRELSRDGVEVTDTTVWSAVIDSLRDEAIATKTAGDTKKVTGLLQELLAVTVITQAEHERYDGAGGRQTRERVLQEVVAGGLATELVTAARESYGLVSVECPKGYV